VIYGVALSGIGMLTLTGNNVSMDTYGPIVDNANGIGEMAHLEPEARQIMADLEAAGNTTKAITKAIAIASAVLAAVSLFGAYIKGKVLGLISVLIAYLSGFLILTETLLALIFLLLGIVFGYLATNRKVLRKVKPF
jgi:K(+)-stimulated pyrophosphate-energized sodium pump